MDEPATSRFATYLQRSKSVPAAQAGSAALQQKRAANIYARNEMANRRILELLQCKVKLANATRNKETLLIAQQQKIHYSICRSQSKKIESGRYAPTSAEMRHILALRNQRISMQRAQAANMKTVKAYIAAKASYGPQQRKTIDSKGAGLYSLRVYNIARYEQARLQKEAIWLARLRQPRK